MGSSDESNTASSAPDFYLTSMDYGGLYPQPKGCRILASLEPAGSGYLVEINPPFDQRSIKGEFAEYGKVVIGAEGTRRISLRERTYWPVFVLVYGLLPPYDPDERSFDNLRLTGPHRAEIYGDLALTEVRPPSWLARLFGRR